MGVNVKPHLKKCGVGVIIHPLAKIIHPHLVEIGDHSRLCDHVYMHSVVGVTVGRYTDIQMFTSIWASGETRLGSFNNIGPGVTFLSGKVNLEECGFMSSVVPPEFQVFHPGLIVTEDHVYIGANCTLMQNITIGEGVVVGANSFVNKDLEPWGVYVGCPARKIAERPKDVIELEKKLDEWEKENPDWWK